MKNSLAVCLVIVAILVSGVAGYFTATATQRLTTTRNYTSTLYSTATAFRIQPTTIILTKTETSTSSFVTNLTQSVTSTEISTSVVSAPNIFSVEDWNMTVVLPISYPIGFAYLPNDIAYNPISGEIYLSGGSDIVAVINATGRNELAPILVGVVDAFISSIDPQTNTLIAQNDVCKSEPNSSGTTCNPANMTAYVAEINGNTDAVTNLLPLNSGSFFAVNIATDTLYETVGCPNPNATTPFNQDLSNCGFLYSYDLKSGSLLANISLGILAYNVILNPRSNMIYAVAGSSYPLGVGDISSQGLLIINGTTNLVQSETPLGFYVTGISLQINPNTNTVFALGANANSTILTALNGSNDRIIYSSAIGSGCNVDTFDYSVNSVTNQIYAGAYNQTLNTNYLLILNANTGQLVNMLSMGGYAYTDSAFNLQANETYLLLSQSPISTTQIPAPDQLVSLPTQLSQTYVDTSLLTSSFCNMIPT